MKRTTAKRGLALMLSTVLFLTLPFLFTQEVSAASKTKTFYVVTKIQSTYTNTDGSTEKNVTTHTYDKNGMLKSTVSKGYTPYYKIVYTRNSAGIVTASKTYNEKGKQTGATINKVKNGNIIKSTTKQIDPKTGKKKTSPTTSYTYKKGKCVKGVTKGSDGSKSTDTYYGNGIIKQSVYESPNSKYVYNYDKKGRLKSSTSSYTYNDQTSNSKTTYIYKETRNKHGDPVKSVETEKTTSDDGITTTNVFTNNYKYTYKSGRVVKVVNTYKTKFGDSTYTGKNTTAYKYKAVKVPQKYWKFFE